jgi:hypothetical protein
VNRGLDPATKNGIQPRGEGDLRKRPNDPNHVCHLCLPGPLRAGLFYFRPFMSEPYAVRVLASEDETYEFSLKLHDFDFDSYTLEYAVGNRSGSQVMHLTQGAGITINTDTETVTFNGGDGALPCGDYEHACRKALADGRTALVFSGPVTITKGPL